MGPRWDDVWPICLAASFGLGVLGVNGLLVNSRTEPSVLVVAVAVPVVVQLWLWGARREKELEVQPSWSRRLLRFLKSSVAPVFVAASLGVWMSTLGVPPTSVLVVMPIAAALLVPLWNWALPRISAWLVRSLLKRRFNASLRSLPLSEPKRAELVRSFEQVLRAQSPEDALAHPSPEAEPSPDAGGPSHRASDVRELRRSSHDTPPDGSAPGDMMRNASENPSMSEAETRSEVTELGRQSDRQLESNTSADEVAQDIQKRTRTERGG